jgi:hypothetical protein
MRRLTGYLCPRRPMTLAGEQANIRRSARVTDSEVVRVMTDAAGVTCAVIWFPCGVIRSIWGAYPLSRTMTGVAARAGCDMLGG